MSPDFAVSHREKLLSTFSFIVERRTVTHGNETFVRDIAVHRGAVAMVAVNDSEQVGLVRQYRAALDRTLWEIPAGTIDVGDDDPLFTAQRELVEEMGVTAAHWRPIATVYVSPGWTDQKMHIYEARELTTVARAPEGPEENAAQTHWFERDEVRQLLSSGEVNDATSTIGLRHFLGIDDYS